MTEKFLGTQKLVTRHGNIVELQLQHGSWTREQAQSMQLLAGIFHILFPKNSPKPIMINDRELLGDKEVHTGKYKIYFEMMDHDVDHIKIMTGNPIDTIGLNRNVLVATARLKEEMKKAGFDFHYGSQNFILHTEPGEESESNYVFIDFDPMIKSGRVLSDKSILQFPIKSWREVCVRIYNAIKSAELMDNERRLAKQYLLKLIKLLKRVEKEYELKKTW